MIENTLFFFKFYSSVLIKIIQILFKKNKVLQELKFNYISQPHTEDGFLLLNFKFNNALYYKINTTKYLYDGSKIIYLKPNNYTISFEAIGFFKKIKKQIIIKPTLQTDFTNFKTENKNLQLHYNKQADLQIINLKRKIDFSKNKLQYEKVKFKKENITIKFETFNQNNYL